MKTLRLTMAQALVKYLTAQQIEIDGKELPFFGGVFAIFGHGNVAGIGEALEAAREVLPTHRAHNEQAMAHAATAYAKAWRRRRVMACTTSIGPGATNLVTAAATAHVNRLPLLLLPGDIFASRRPDPVLQQVEWSSEPGVTANDCLRPVSRYWDRINRPEQLISALPAAMRVLTDPVECGPATLCLPQDVQTEAYDYPLELFDPVVRHIRRPPPEGRELAEAAQLMRSAKQPLLIAGGGVHYSGAFEALAAFAERHDVPVCETQAGKASLSWDHPLNVGSVGVTGTSAANALAERADVVLAVGTRLSDFTTASRTLFQNPNLRLIGLNVGSFDAFKHGAHPLVADAQVGLGELSESLSGWRANPQWINEAKELRQRWLDAVDIATAAVAEPPFSDAHVLGAVNRVAQPEDVVICAAGGLPGELHKLWRASKPGGYHLEYGNSCMGYEIAGGLGVKIARPDQEVWVMVGDGSYMMMNSELATSIMLGHKVNIVLLDNHGFGCINRLQRSLGGTSFNNLLRDSEGLAPSIDFAAHAVAQGAKARKVSQIADLEDALRESRSATSSQLTVIETDPELTTEAGGAWWDVAVAQISERDEVRRARDDYESATARQKVARP